MKKLLMVVVAVTVLATTLFAALNANETNVKHESKVLTISEIDSDASYSVGQPYKANDGYWYVKWSNPTENYYSVYYTYVTVNEDVRTSYFTMGPETSSTTQLGQAKQCWIKSIVEQ